MFSWALRSYRSHWCGIRLIILTLPEISYLAMHLCVCCHGLKLLGFIYLQGIPEAAEVAAPVARPPAPVPGAAPSIAPAPTMLAAPAPAASGGPNVAPLDLFPQV